MNSPNATAAFAVMAGALAVTQAYAQVGPSLQDLRNRDIKDTTGRQHLLDTNILVGGIAFIAGGFASWATHSIVPLLALMAIYIFIVGWYTLVLNSPNDHVERKD